MTYDCKRLGKWALAHYRAGIVWLEGAAPPLGQQAGTWSNDPRGTKFTLYRS
jgi:hypothetical protein